MRKATEIARLRELCAGAGLRSYEECRRLVSAATRSLPDDPRIERLRVTMIDLLQAIELETILGGNTESCRQKLGALLDWVEKVSSPA